MLINGTRGKKVFRIYEQTKSMKNSQRELIKFDLLENAKDSLFHAVEHLTNEGKKPNAGDYKRVILDVSHTVELLLKERVQRIHPAFLWKRVEEFGDPDAQTIGVEQAVTRLLKIGNIVLSEKALKTIMSCKRIRNSIEHHAFEIESKKARAVIGRILSFIFTFSNKHLGLDLESDFRRDDRWKSLIEIYEFFEEHSKALEEELCNKGAWVINCPQCGAQTFNVSLTRACRGMPLFVIARSVSDEAISVSY